MGDQSEDYIRGWNDAIEYMNKQKIKPKQKQNMTPNSNVELSLLFWKEADSPVPMLRNNLNKTCYGNSIIQCLNACDLLSFLSSYELLSLRPNSKGYVDGTNVYKRVFKNSLEQNDVEEFLIKYLDMNSRLEEKFTFKIITRVSCSKCNYTSISHELDKIIRLPHKYPCDVIDALNQYETKEIVNYNCKCGNNKLTKRVEIDSFSDVIVVSYMRYRYDDTLKKYVKSDDKIEIDDRFKVASTINYNLVGVIEHDGTVNNGHYVALVKHKLNWWRCDDKNIQIIHNIKSKLSNNSLAYMMFYLRETI